ncbi:hypothetical protein D3C85_1778770 [compost metagenome]
MQTKSLQVFGLTLYGENRGIGIAEDDQPPFALLTDQVFELRRSGVDQQAIVSQQQLQIMALV